MALQGGMEFEIIKSDEDTNSRAGILRTDHGDIQTPVFMPVGTLGSVKAVHQRELRDDIGAQIILSNTYHMNLRPGTEVVRKAGGLHRFIKWERPILTDSGGFQVYSLAENRKISEEGVSFRSHIDGSSHFLSPESATAIQMVLGSDIIMAFDECTPYPCEYSEAKKSMELTHRWLDRCIRHFNNSDPIYDYGQNMFPIVQGGTHKDLRKISAEKIAEKELPGNAIGGLSVGEPAEEMYEMTDEVCHLLPPDKPRYLMGVGTPVNILECISLGVDMFDCVIPTRNARNGMLFTSKGVVNIRNEKWKFDYSPIDPDFNCFADEDYSRGYLRHLFISGERLASQIASIHNLAFYIWLMKESRKQIIEGNFKKWKSGMINQLSVRL